MKMKKELCQEIIKKYLFEKDNGRSISLVELSSIYNLKTWKISDILEKHGVREKDKSCVKKGGFSEDEKLKIIDLYENQKRGKSYIGKQFNCSGTMIAKWLEKWNVKTIAKSEISKKIREVYGRTKGFSGKKHSEESKEKISNSGRKNWSSGKRKVDIGKSRMYKTIIGTVMGKFEVAYLQIFKNNGNPLPKICNKRYKTPFGTYKPDFEIDGLFIEVKSKFTLKVAQGKYHNNKGKYDDNQWKKINFFKENIAPLEIVVLDGNEVQKLFKNATILI